MKTLAAVFFILSGFSFIMPAAAQVQCPAGVAGYWPMDVDGTEVVTNTPGALVGNVSFGAGQAGQAAYIDGDVGSYIDAGSSAALSLAGASAMPGRCKRHECIGLGLP
jgi:hypothetical protein